MALKRLYNFAFLVLFLFGACLLFVQDSNIMVQSFSLFGIIMCYGICSITNNTKPDFLECMLFAGGTLLGIAIMYKFVSYFWEINFNHEIISTYIFMAFAAAGIGYFSSKLQRGLIRSFALEDAILSLLLWAAFCLSILTDNLPLQMGLLGSWYFRHQMANGRLDFNSKSFFIDVSALLVMTGLVVKGMIDVEIGFWIQLFVSIVAVLSMINLLTFLIKSSKKTQTG